MTTKGGKSGRERPRASRRTCPTTSISPTPALPAGLVAVAVEQPSEDNPAVAVIPPPPPFPSNAPTPARVGGNVSEVGD